MKKLLLLFSILLVIAGCEKEPAPEDRLTAYTKLWNEQKFDQMYDYLSTDAKETLSKKDFTERYEKIYKDIEVNNLKVTYKKPEDPENHDETATLPFSVKMDTLAGAVSFDQQAKLVKEERDDQTNWYINWNPGYIFAGMKENDEIGMTTDPAVRGEIIDRLERGLAMNGSVAEVSIVPEKMADEEAGIISQVGSLLNMSNEEIEKKLNQSWVQPHMSVPIKKVDPAQTALLDKLKAIPSVAISDVAERVYPYKEITAHLIGYVGAISAEELEKRKGKGYSASDVIGKRGLEQILEDQLKGKSGAKIFIKGENGQDKVVAETPAEEGETIMLTIDAELQKDIFAQYKNDTGSAAAIHPLTGETLALVSSPSFDPNKFVLGISNEERKQLEDNPDKPLLNRFSSVYAPGSTIKPLTAAISLKNGVDPAKTMKVSGKQWSKENWKDHSITRVKDPGKPVNMSDALIYSDNIYFAQRALELGTDKFSDGLKSFGYEEEMPFDYPIKSSKIGKIESEGRLADSGYGQGQTQMSTLHVATAYTAFQNEGNVLAPSLIIGDKTEKKVWIENAISADQATQVSDMLEKVITDPYGTPHSASELGIPLAGKTGTAEMKRTKAEKGAENGWFAVYNTENPRLLMAWMMENVEDKGGSPYVVEKAKPVLEKHLK
ncbi:penicillin-binding transpeptidase domain-containing protein [Bacillus sp. V59.32b]|uniref:penicillin-binding transpeptidase domain-containing protein n=1 Tax=Bacillus sp. V59.32b TaxID=1758642 RepID=UPI000E3BEDB0|nr:penicillin-binding transpeptidase domain-containing protein [Bacillus sp. V59.32b]RFU66817.1 penicillin-binding transpeptidase domain-containing protein [Bacillus sp. V59.32b]